MITLLTLIDNEPDRERFKRLYEEYKHTVFAVCYKVLSDEGLAEDAVQETFLRIAVYFGRYDFNRNLITTIARNAALNILEKQKREIATDDIEAYSDSSLSDGDYDYDLKRDSERIFDIVSAMPEIYADVFYMRYSHELKYSEIAVLLGVTVSAAKKRVQRAKEYIRNAVEREELQNETD